MRRAARVDANQPEIIEALRRAGCSVQPLHAVGGGCPDLLVGRAGQNYLFELKDPNASNRDRKLRDTQVTFFALWEGQVNKIETAEEALEIMGLSAVRNVPFRGVIR